MSPLCMDTSIIELKNKGKLNIPCLKCRVGMIRSVLHRQALAMLCDTCWDLSDCLSQCEPRCCQQTDSV